MHKDHIKYIVILLLTALLTYGLATVRESIAHGATVSLSSNLYLGSRGSDVADLQSWLISQGFDIPSVASGAAQPGYYGQQTLAAVAAYQRAHGLPTTGYFGPLTREAANRDGGNAGGNAITPPYLPRITGNPLPQPAGSFKVLSPNGGEAWQKGSAQTIRWSSPTYIRPASVDIKLLRTTTCTAPVCPLIAYAPLTIATGVSAYQATYIWSAGDVLEQATPNVRTIAPDGLYTIQICESGTTSCDQSDSAFTLFSPANSGSGSGNGLPPVISGIDAPTSLKAYETGAWTVHASDPERGTLSYAVDWGDKPMATVGSTLTVSDNQYVQTATFTHAYQTTGTYAVTFTVRDSAGLTAQSKATVSVGAVSASALTVSSPNGGEAWKIGTQHEIDWANGIYSWPYGNTGYVRITLDYRCPAGSYCAQMYYPTYIIQNSAPNDGKSAWIAGSVTVNGTSGTTAPPGTYIVTVCRYDNSALTACDSSDSPFTLAN